MGCSVIDEMAVGYDLNGSVAPLTDLGWLGPAGQMYSTVNDLAKVLSQCLLTHFNCVHAVYVMFTKK